MPVAYDRGEEAMLAEKRECVDWARALLTRHM